MDAFRQWALCIIISAAAGTFACAVLPRGSAEKTVRTVAGIFVVAAICAPLSQLDFEEFSLPAFARSYDTEADPEELDDYILSVCKSAADREISAAAKAHGITVEAVFIDAYVDENSCIIMQNIQIDIRSGDIKSASDFSEDVEKRIGVSVNIRNGILG